MIEFSFIYCTLLIHISVFTLIYKVLCVSFESFPLVHLLVSFNKEKEKEKKINNDLVIWPSHNRYRGGGEGNTFNRGGTQTGPRRDPNAMDVDKGRGGGGIGHTMYIGSGAIWPKIVGKDTKEE